MGTWLATFLCLSLVACASGDLTEEYPTVIDLESLPDTIQIVETVNLERVIEGPWYQGGRISCVAHYGPRLERSDFKRPRPSCWLSIHRNHVPLRYGLIATDEQGKEFRLLPSGFRYCHGQSVSPHYASGCGYPDGSFYMRDFVLEERILEYPEHDYIYAHRALGINLRIAGDPSLNARPGHGDDLRPPNEGFVHLPPKYLDAVLTVFEEQKDIDS